MPSKLRVNSGYYQRDGGLVASGRNGELDMPAVVTEFDDGTGDYEINEIYNEPFTIPAGQHVTIDLQGGDGEKNVLNGNLHFVAVKKVIISINAPARDKFIVFGPQGISQAAQLWIRGEEGTEVGTGSLPIGSEEIRDKLVQTNPVEGWPVDANNKLLRLSNPTSFDISGKILIEGCNE